MWLSAINALIYKLELSTTSVFALNKHMLHSFLESYNQSPKTYKKIYEYLKKKM